VVDGQKAIVLACLPGLSAPAEALFADAPDTTL
jgi:hypothetical protein